MLGCETLTGFFLAAVVLALVPGPDNLYVLTQSMLLGRRAGLVATCGFCTGLVVHTLGVALGVAALLQTSSLAFILLKLCGAGYLIYLAWRLLGITETGEGASGLAEASPWRLYRRSIIMNVTNPKVALFFLAFLPQFTDPGAGPVVWQMLLFGLLFMLATLLVFGSVALLATGIASGLMQRPRVQLQVRRLAALIFLLLAIRLALAGN